MIAALARVHAVLFRCAARRLACGPAAFALRNETEGVAASSGHAFVSKTVFLDDAMHDLSATLCRGITRQVLATVPLHARLNGHRTGSGLPFCSLGHFASVSTPTCF